VHAVVVPSDTALEPEMVLGHAREHMAGYKRPSPWNSWTRCP